MTGNQQPGDLAGACLKRSKSSKELVGDVKNPVELQRGYINAEKGFLGSSFVKRVRSHPLRESIEPTLEYEAVPDTTDSGPWSVSFTATT